MGIVFSHTQRDRPIVLTDHEVKKLSASAGRDVSKELSELAGQTFCARTLGQLMRDLRAALGAQKTWGDVLLSKIDDGMDHGSAAFEADQWDANNKRPNDGGVAPDTAPRCVKTRKCGPPWRVATTEGLASTRPMLACTKEPKCK
mgnify:CR=1 FL=1